MKYELKEIIRPIYLDFADKSLAIATAYFLTLCQNDEGDRITLSRHPVLTIYKDKTVSLYSDNSSTVMGLSIIKITSWDEMIKAVTEAPITIGAYDVIIETSGVQVGCTHVPWETIERLIKKRPTTSDESGYRMLDDDEKGIPFNYTKRLKEIEILNTNGKWTGGNRANDKTATYRTKLSREELKAKRNE